MKTWLKIVLIAVGLFVAYNVMAILYVTTQYPTRASRMVMYGKLAPYLLWF